MVNKFLFPKSGAEVSTMATGRLLEEKGHSVAFWGMKHPRNADYPYSNKFVSYIDYNEPRGIVAKIRNAANLLYSLEAREKIESVINDFNPDIVHVNNIAHQLSPSILSVFKKHRIPVIMTLRDFKMVCPAYLMFLGGEPCEFCRGGNYYNCLLHKCTKNSSLKSLLNTVEMYLHHSIFDIYGTIKTFISPSKFMFNKVKEMGFKKNIVHLYNFTNKNIADTKSIAYGDYIVYVGRLSAEKGLFTLIDGVKKTGIALKIIGDGPLLESLQKKIAAEKLYTIELLGHKDGEELDMLIKGCAFSVISSEWYENNPRSVIESFAFGKPVIGSRIGGIPELIIDNVTGLTYEPGNPEDLEEKILSFFSDKSLIEKLGKNALRFVRDEFNEEKHYTGLMGIYSEAKNR